MGDQAEYKYDVFISYSHADRAWVWDELLPQLEQAGLKVCIDKRDFKPGLPILVNLENAAEGSRKTIIVLTRAWVESEWTAFESLLIQTDAPAGRSARIIPVLLKPCEPPKRIAILTHIDFTDPLQRDAQMARLLKSLGSPGSPPVLRPDYVPEKETKSGLANDDKPVQSTKLSEKITRILSARMWQGIALDMTGNVWEWVSDWYSPTYYGDRPDPDTSPPGPTQSESNGRKVIRGGSYDTVGVDARTAERNAVPPGPSYDIGFRCAMSE